MGLKEQVYSVLVVSRFENFNLAVKDLLSPVKYQPVSFATNVSEAKRILSERSYDFVLVNSPLPEEFGSRFAIDCCHGTSTVVLMLVKSELYEEILDKANRFGVFVVAKPVSKLTLMQTFGFLTSARERLRTQEMKTCSIEEKMAEIRLINRAKCVLISELKMTEPDAHHYIEKKAMDQCITKKEVAEKILQTYL